MFHFRVIAILFFTGLSAKAQTPAPIDARVQSSLIQAARTARLNSEGTPPFHIDATFATFDDQGKPNGSGTVMEEWLKVGTWRREVTFAGLHWTEVSRAGVVRSEGDDPLNGSFLERRVIAALLDPVVPEKRLQAGATKSERVQVGSVPLDCVTLLHEDLEEANLAIFPPPTYCISEDPPMLRVIHEQYGMSILYSHFVHVGARVAAMDVSLARGEVTRATLHVTNIKAAPALQENDFLLPVGPLSRGEAPHLASRDAKAYLLKKISPRYPDDARRAGVSGTVTIDAVIDETGSVRQAEVVSGPLLLREASLAAVKQWLYRPYLQDDKPVEVTTSVMVNFSFEK